MTHTADLVRDPNVQRIHVNHHGAVMRMALPTAFTTNAQWCHPDSYYVAPLRYSGYEDDDDT